MIKLALALLLSLYAASFSHAEENWLQWRGLNRDGVITGANWPADLSEKSLRKVWNVELGPGYSGPLITRDRVFVTETRDETDEAVRALDRKTGKEIWSASWTGSMTVPFFAAANGSWIRSTPTLDGDDLFVAGMRDVLICFDAATGKERWRVDFVRKLDAKLPTFGCVCSPLVDGEHVYIQAGGGFVKLNRANGSIVWKTLDDGGGMYGSAFSSPVISELAGHRQAVVQSRTKLAGVDLQTGGVLWSTEIEAFRGMNILTPTIVGNRVFTSSYGGGSYFFEISFTPDNGFQVNQLWRNKVQGYMSSPVVIDGHIYLHLRNQRFVCINLASGKETWISQPFGKYWSMITNGTQILALDERGELLLIEASPKELQIVARQKISNQPTWAHLAVADNHLVVRDLGAVRVLRFDQR